MLAGVLELQMMANMAKLSDDMASAKNMVGSAMDNIMSKVNQAQNLLMSLGIMASASGLINLAEQSVAAAAEMYHLSEKTGVAVESLSGLRSAAKLSGTSMDDVGNGLVKLSKNMIDAQSGTGKAAETFAALGISVTNSNGSLKTADQVMLEVAKALQGFEAGAGTTTAMLNIFGKAGAGLIPMLKDLAEKGDLVGKITTEQARQADEYEKSLVRLKSSTEGVVRGLALEFLPVLVKLTDLIKPAVEVGTALALVFWGFPALCTLATAAFDAYALSVYSGTAATAVFRTTVATLGPTFAAMTAQFGLFQTVVMSGLGVLIAAFAGWKIGEWAYENFLSARLAAVAFVDGTMTVWEYLKYAGNVLWLGFQTAFESAREIIGTGLAWLFEKVANGLRAIGLTALADSLGIVSKEIVNATAKTIDFDTEAAKFKTQMDSNILAVHDITSGMADEAIAHFNGTEALKKKKAALDLATGATKELTAAQEAATKAGLDLANESENLVLKLYQQLETGQKLTSAEELLLKLERDLTSGKAAMTREIEMMTRANLEDAIAIEKKMKLLAEEKKLQEEVAKDQEAAQMAIVKKTAAMQDENDKLAENNLAIKLGKDAYAQHTIQMMLNEAQRLEGIAATKDDTGALVANSAELLKQAGILRQRADLAQEGIVLKEASAAQKAWEATTKAIGDGLSSALTDALMNGRSLWDAFKAWLINSILEGAIKNALSSVIQSGLNSMFGTTLFSAGGSAVGSAVGAGAAGGGILAGAGTALGINSAGFTGTGLTGALGIGASAGAGVTTTGVVGGGAGAAVGVDLGLLGSGTGTAVGAGAGSASGLMAGLGTAALGVGLIFALASLSGGSRDYQLVGTQQTPELDGKYGYTQDTGEASSEYRLLYDMQVSKFRDVENGNIMYEVRGTGANLGSYSAADLTSTFGIPAFAQGTDFFGGGLRLVGERGPELEATGASRIWDATTTASMLRSGGASGSELADELRLLRAEVQGLRAEARATAEHTSNTHGLLERAMPGGNAMNTRAV